MNGKQDQNIFRQGGRKGLRRFVLLLLVGLGGGAGLPHLLAGRLPVPGPPPADAILVLTGDENRIPEGFRAWKDGKARELYILGAGEGARLEKVLPGRTALPPSAARKLHLEGWSENTLENAYSAKSVIAERGFRKVILVTSDYHVPRAYLSFRAILPKALAIEVIPVRTEWKDRAAFPRTLRLFFVEGWKYWWYRIFLYWE
jgi:uncharacterized SAM-binding protein YcdF (DUF218 family)